MYQFRPLGQPGVIRLADGVVIPPDPQGAAWHEYMLWMYAGNEALPAEVIELPKPQLSKIVIIQRLSDSELEALDTARQARPLRERLLWETAQSVNPDDEMLRAFFTSVVGEQRTSEVLSVVVPG